MAGNISERGIIRLSRRNLFKVTAVTVADLAATACFGGGPGPTGAERNPSATPKPTGAGAGAQTVDNKTARISNTSNWNLMHPDSDGKMVPRTMPEGFTPDPGLFANVDITPLSVGDPARLDQYRDWEATLNTGRPVGDRLAGYNYDYNDFCQAETFKCNSQLDMFGWRVYQGQEVHVPGIGKLVGGPRRSVLVLITNLADDVKAYDKDEAGQVFVKRGFTATGRIFDGNKIQITERNLLGHWLFRQKEGTPEKSYVGITDSPDNALETLLVSVVRKQWGNNPDGSKRYEDQLLRAEVLRLK